jgi:hypothetical protein
MGVGRKATTARKAVFVNRGKMRHLRAISPRRSIPERRSKRSRSKLSSVRVRLLNQATLSSAQMSENASKNHHRSQQRLLRRRISSPNSSLPRCVATSSRDRPRPHLNRRLPRSLPTHPKAKARVKVTEIRRRTTRKTKTVTEPIRSRNLLAAEQRAQVRHHVLVSEG